MSAASLSAVVVPAQQLFAWQRAVAGMAAYCSATFISSPIDVLKTRMQLRKAESSGMFPLAITMLRTEGALVFLRYWSGALHGASRDGAVHTDGPSTRHDAAHHGCLYSWRAGHHNQVPV